MSAIVITGGAGGIGRALARRAAEAGWRPITLDLRKPEDMLPSEVFVPCDFADAAMARDTLAETASRHAPTRLVNNVGIVRPAPLEETSIEDLAAVMDVNLRSAVLAAQALLPSMQAAGFGRIVNIASRAALGKELRTAYAASKAGLLGLTRTWALELAARGITVNAIGPGPIATELFRRANPDNSPRTRAIIEGVPVRRLGTPEDVAHAAAFFLDDRAGFVTGQTVYVCGGLTVGLAPA
ncbi:short-chain dehydrogenase [Falsiroseomonas bella]|uniref:Short-chain dehydrogenase n=1 Tax=Falsiroseomonas bella TaxID=2184016 RepID=A0A317FKN7_9PROT|nr:SDR family oxidoreductase [Falsiroseomonas bella]PWS38156.1 short-chain dehydrogenase [Falsiroseomonas bella]